MAKPKDDITTYTKPELIKALRASVAREGKLQKKYDSLLDQLAKRACEPPPDDTDHGVVHVTQEPALNEVGREFNRAAAEEAAYVAPNADFDTRGTPPAFPWDVK